MIQSRGSFTATKGSDVKICMTELKKERKKRRKEKKGRKKVCVSFFLKEEKIP